MPQFAFEFSEGTKRQLAEIVKDASENSKETVTERKWLTDQVHQMCADVALAWRTIEGEGRWQAGNAPPPLLTPIYVTAEDLREFKLVPGGDGYPFFLSDKTMARIERAVSIVAAKNKALGMGIAQPWSTANEWLVKNLTQRIAQARAQLDMREIIEEDKAQEAQQRLAEERKRRLDESLGSGARRESARPTPAAGSEA